VTARSLKENQIVGDL